MPTGSSAMRRPRSCAGSRRAARASFPRTTSLVAAGGVAFSRLVCRAHLAIELDAAQREAYETVVQRVLARNLAEARVFVHRDFMPRNLMVAEPNPGILDFQDAVHGPISYDVACLYRDAFVSWSEERVLDGTIRYWEKARAARLPVPADFAEFWKDVEWMAVQRHLKVLGIFARLAYRDGKKLYLEDTPRFIGYVRHAVSRYAELAPLGRLLDQLEGARPEVRFTFKATPCSTR
jgi:aminoglycoside/choline kinase family phosphotransferase